MAMPQSKNNQASGTRRVFLSAAEASGDSHCAELIHALRETGAGIEFVGVGGRKMRLAGCRLLETTTDRAVMTYKAFRHIGRYWRLIRKIRRCLDRQRIDLVIVCDSPSFNFHVARAARKRGIDTLFYVAPQLWAWAGWRIRKLRRCCTRLACILPFEQEYFTKRGVDAVFAGNPLLNGLPENLESYRRSYDEFEPERSRFVMLPGSRPAEIESLWLPMQQIAVELKKSFPGATFVAVAVDDKTLRILKQNQVEQFDCRYTTGRVIDNARVADFAIVASGSATLEVAAAGCPMVIMYQSSRLLWQLAGRFIVKTRHLSLVNILAQKRMVPEFMPYFASTQPITAEIKAMLNDPSALSRLSGGLIDLAQSLHTHNASEKVAEIVLEMLPRNKARF